MENILYVSAIGSIMYAMLYTIPNVTYVLRVMSIFLANQGERH